MISGIQLPRTLHTIHHHMDRRPFTVHMDQRTYLLCFEQRNFAMMVSHILESHHRREGSWPNTEVSVDKPLLLNYDKDSNFMTDYVNRTLSDLYVQEWDNTDLLNEYIINHLFHIMVIEGHHNHPTTRCITLRYPEEHIRRILENRDHGTSHDQLM